MSEAQDSGGRTPAEAGGDAAARPADAVYAVPDPAVFSPIVIDEELCIGCNLCVFVCQADLFLPNEARGGAPSVVYAGECWYEGSCVDHCPVPGAITLNTLLFNRVHWEESRTPEE